MQGTDIAIQKHNAPLYMHMRTKEGYVLDPHMLLYTYRVHYY